MDYKKIISGTTKNELKNALEAIEEIIKIDNRYKNAYFWEPHWRAHERRCAEKSDKISFSIGENQFSYWYSYRETCRNCYFEKETKANDIITTMRTIRTLHKYILKKLEEN